MKKNRKILLAGGCSFTHHTRLSSYNSSLITNFPRWPKVLADKLDLECVNLAQLGWGNQLISTSIFEYLMENPKKEIGLVCCLWTDYTRTSIYNMSTWPMNMIPYVGLDTEDMINSLITTNLYAPEMKAHWARVSREGPDKFLDLLYYYIKGTHTKAETIVENIIKNNIKIFHDLECMLSIRNIPYLYFQGLPPFLRPDIIKKDRGLEKIYAPSIEQLLFYFLKYEKYFNKEKFIGWPLLPINGKIYKNEDQAVSCWISEIDKHPNEKGHRVIAAHFYRKIKELYSHLLKKEINEE